MEEFQQYLYRLKPTRQEMLLAGLTEQEEKIVSQHFDYLLTLMKEGTVLFAGRTLNTDETSFGIVIFQAETESSAYEIIQNDPAVEKQMMTAELFPFRIALVGDISDLES